MFGLRTRKEELTLSQQLFGSLGGLGAKETRTGSSNFGGCLISSIISTLFLDSEKGVGAFDSVSIISVTGGRQKV